MEQGDDYNKNLEGLYAKLNELEQRLSNVEQEMKAGTSVLINDSNYLSESAGFLLEGKTLNKSIGFESRVGGYGMAIIGNIVLLFGIIFLSQYIQSSGYSIFSAVFGFVSSAAIFVLAHFTKKSIKYLSSLFNLTGHLLLYYSALKLHFFTDTPVIKSLVVSLITIFILIGIQIYISIRDKSRLYYALAITLSLITGFISLDYYLILSLTTAVSAISMFLFFRNSWKNILILSIILSYLSFIIWLIFDTTASKVPNSIPYHYYSYIFLFLVAGSYSFLALIPRSEKMKNIFIISSLILNGMLFSSILFLFVTTFFINNYTFLFVTVSVFCIAYSIILKLYSDWKFSPAFYAMYGFVAISITVFGIFKIPNIFLLLAVQSLFVTIIALWFRSRLIVTMNAILFHLLLITYLFNSGSINSINITFSVVAVLTAWILNYKKQLLELDSNILTNIYTVTIFSMVLFSLYKIVPPQYVTLSWTISAIVYFLGNIIFKSVTLRWMAILTMIATAFYLFTVDLSRISIVYRIIAFMFLAVISISISIYYIKNKKAGDNSEEDTELTN